ncbi:LysR family transcriptional regulator [Vibrio coralliilyticus]|uniref:LysR family transcriptional regulator n=1 Tax=Vibrio coralliilyticus TaxID=190893 RepID=UPI0006CCFA6E|nr:LysR family transcriptional regulator [Vibrio coralliilyticus]AXN34002.1 LysR family transcriptional regulator [Vibrio coralliilyticus]KPH24460.1 LysR family transcriptional regulator [Vibrio coralliilyticus]
MNNYKLLRPLLVLLQTRSLTEAALQLNVTQSAMSRTLSQIRTAFDDPILIREGKQFVVSARGQQLLAQLPELIGSLDELYAVEAFLPHACQREFRLAYTAFLSESSVPLVSSELLRLAPNAGVNGELWQDQHVSVLGDSPIDVLATTLDYFPENIYGKKLLEDEYVVLMSGNHSLADASLEMDDYFSASHVMVHGMREMRQYVGEKFEQRKVHRKVIARVPSFTAAMELVCQSDALVTAPLHLAGYFSNRFDYVVKPLPFDLPKHSYYLLWHSRHQKDPAHRWFRQQSFAALQRHLKLMYASGVELM